MLRLAAFDLDGTLFTSASAISPGNRAALDHIRRLGVMTVIASGRPYEVIRQVMGSLDLDSAGSYCIAMNGAAVMRCGDDAEIAGLTVTGESVREVAEFAFSQGAEVHAFSLERGLLLSALNPYSAKEFFGGLVPYTVTDFLKIPAGELFRKVLMAAPPEILDRAAGVVPEGIRRRFRMIRSLPTLLEFLDPAAGKGPALERLAGILGVAPSEIIAFGDEENDLDMLRFAGTGVAMGNASPILKGMADYVTLTNDEDGVAHALYRFFPPPGGGAPHLVRSRIPG